MHQAVDG